MLRLALSRGKTEHFTGPSNNLLQSSDKGLSKNVLHSSVAALVLKLRMLKVAFLQGHNVISN